MDYKEKIKAATSFQDILDTFEYLFPEIANKRIAFESRSFKVLAVVSVLQDSNAAPEVQYEALKQWDLFRDTDIVEMFKSPAFAGVDYMAFAEQRSLLRRDLPIKMLDSYVITAQDMTVTLNSIMGKQGAYKKAYADLNRMQEEIHAKYKPLQEALDVELREVSGNMDSWCANMGYGMWDRVKDGSKWRPWTPESQAAYLEEYNAGQQGFRREMSVLRNGKPFLQKKAEELAALPWDEMKAIRSELDSAKEKAYDQVINTLLAKSPVTEDQARDWAKQNVIFSKPAMAKAAKSGYGKKDIERDTLLFYRLTGGRLPRLEFTTTRKSRSCAAHWSGELFIGHNFGRRTLWHEMAHLLEDDEKIKVTAIAFRNRRRESPQLHQLRNLVPGSNYGPEEVAYKDSWISEYVGKDYGQTATEVVSMGMQQLSSIPALFELHETDPEHLAFMLGLCASKPVIDVEAMHQKQAVTQEKVTKVNAQEDFLKTLDKQIAKVGDFWSADGYVINTENRYSYKTRKSVDRTEIRYNLKYDETGSLKSYNSYSLRSEKIAKRALFIWYKAGRPTESNEANGLNLGNIVYQLESKRNKTLPEYILQTPLGAE